jgi:hypothetical protein
VALCGEVLAADPAAEHPRRVLSKKNRQYLYAALLWCDDSYPSNSQRWKAFVQQGLGSRATFYNHLKALKIARRFFRPSP